MPRPGWEMGALASFPLRPDPTTPTPPPFPPLPQPPMAGRGPLHGSLWHGNRAQQQLLAWNRWCIPCHSSSGRLPPMPVAHAMPHRPAPLAADQLQEVRLSAHGGSGHPGVPPVWDGRHERRLLVRHNGWHSRCWAPGCWMLGTACSLLVAGCWPCCCAAGCWVQGPLGVASALTWHTCITPCHAPNKLQACSLATLTPPPTGTATWASLSGRGPRICWPCSRPTTYAPSAAGGWRVRSSLLQASAATLAHTASKFHTVAHHALQHARCRAAAWCCCCQTR